MKKMSLLLLAAFALAVTVNAQGGMQRRTVAERVAIIHAKLDSAFKLDSKVATNVDSVFAEYYRATDKMREEIMANTPAGERPDFQAMQAKMQPITDARDEKLKKLLTEGQYESWKKDIEPSMRRPQRPQGGGGNR